MLLGLDPALLAAHLFLVLGRVLVAAVLRFLAATETPQLSGMFLSTIGAIFLARSQELVPPAPRASTEIDSEEFTDMATVQVSLFLGMTTLPILPLIE